LREDHLTECFAGWLDIDHPAREAYCDLVFRPYAATAGWASPQIVDIDTQRSLSSGRPDLILTLGDGHVVAVEHKIDAIETVGVISEDGEQLGQLRRYLNDPDVAAVAFVRSTLRPPGAEVLANPKYIRPPDRHHFLWRDFYPLLEASTNRYASWLRESFEADGYTPPHAFVGELTDRDARINFAKYWLPVRAVAHDLGWDVGTGSVVELYLSPREPNLPAAIWINPTDSLLVVRTTPSDPTKIDRIAQLLADAASKLGFPDVTDIRSVPRSTGKVTVVDIAAPMQRVLGDADSGPAVESHLLAFVEPLLRALSTDAKAAG
jgi:hypothetical protein